MIGGVVIENRICVNSENSPECHLWVIDPSYLVECRECIVRTAFDETADVLPLDRVHWHDGIIYWSRDGVFKEREIRMVGNPLNPWTVNVKG